MMMLHFLLPLALCAAVASAGPVTLLEVPNAGVQPQALVDAGGKLHLLFLAGPAGESDVFHTTLNPRTKAFAKPTRVNHTAGNAVAMGSIRGAQGAWGRDGRLHVVWNASVPDADGKSHMEVCYTRSDSTGEKFEPERGLMHAGKFLDGGATIAADQQGNVYVLWHAMPLEATPDAGHGEASRIIYLAKSSDDGRTFTKDAPCTDAAAGICACCSMRATTLASGELVVLYRSADGSGRSMQSLRSTDHGAHFKVTELQPWLINACPMSSSGLHPTPQGVMAAWETDSTIWTANLDGASMTPRKISTTGSKHPSLARDEHGRTLLTWARDTGWQRGGTLAWSLLDAQGKVSIESTANSAQDANLKVPVWSFPAAAFVKGLGFVIVH